MPMRRYNSPTERMHRQRRAVDLAMRRAERDTQARLAEDIERTNRLLGITRADVAELLDEPLLEVDDDA